MTTISEQYVASLTDHEREAIIESFEKFRRDGIIGEEPCRTFARELAAKCASGSDPMIVMWINLLAHECWRYYALKYLRER